MKQKHRLVLILLALAVSPCRWPAAASVDPPQGRESDQFPRTYPSS